MTPSRVLILGGTTEASALCRRLAGDPAIAPILSLAGRTKHPVLPPVPCRIGGFGGIAGLAHYLRAEDIALLIDATHPFAAQISRHAVEAAADAAIPLLALRRPAWHAQPGDHWIDVPDIAAAATAIGPAPRRVFLTIGQQDLAPFCGQPQHDYVVRSVDPPPPHTLPPRATVITARGPFDAASETALLDREKIDIIVTKNAGGTAIRAKLDAARARALPVVMVARPQLPVADCVLDVEAVLEWIKKFTQGKRFLF